MVTNEKKSQALKSREVFLESEIHGMVFRTEPAESWGKIKWYGKVAGGQEFPTEASTNAAFDARNEWKEISAEKYKKY